MAIPKNEIAHDVVSERLNALDGFHDQQALLSEEIVKGNPALRSLVPASYRMEKY